MQRLLKHTCNTKLFEKETFRFLEVNIEDTKKDMLKLDRNKVSQHSDIPIKIIKEILDIVAKYQQLYQIIFVPILFKDGRCDSFKQKY